MKFNNQPVRTTLSILAVVAISLTLTACEECEEIDVSAYEDQITAEDQALVEEHGYFNITSDCKDDEAELACANTLPQECGVACREGYTCTQVELEKIQCYGFFDWTNPGRLWKRKCLEVPNN